MRTCKICKTKFEPQFNSVQMTCSVKCAISYSNKLKENDWKKRKAKIKKDMLTVQDYVKLAQGVFNKWIRERDKGQPCISCGKKINGVKHASHYMSAGGHSIIRFHEDNVWTSCYSCNVALSGNLIKYRMKLIDKIGVERVEFLEVEGQKEKHWTIDELKEIIKKYKL